MPASNAAAFHIGLPIATIMTHLEVYPVLAPSVRMKTRAMTAVAKAIRSLRVLIDQMLINLENSISSSNRSHSNNSSNKSSCSSRIMNLNRNLSLSCKLSHLLGEKEWAGAANAQLPTALRWLDARKLYASGKSDFRK